MSHIHYFQIQSICGKRESPGLLLRFFASPKVIAADSQTHKANFYTHNYGLAGWLEREN